MARKWKVVLGVLAVLVLAVAGYVVYLFALAGQFKTIAPHFAGDCHAVAGVVGPEDITILPDGSQAYISSDDRRATMAGRPVAGGIYGYDLTRFQAVPRNLTPDADASFHPHGISVWVGADGRTLVFVVNHPGSSLFGSNPGTGPAHTIEVLEQMGDGTLFPRQTIESPLLVSPNDVLAVAEDRFYVTNDHGTEPGLGRTLEDYLRLSKANVLYFDGGELREVAGDLRYANGIAVSPDGRRLYVSTVTSFAIAVFDRDPDSGALTPAGEIELGTGPDNIELDVAGDLWVGAHPKLFSFVAYSRDAEERSPSQVLRIHPIPGGGYDVTEVFLSLGDDLSGSSVAAVRGDRLLIGSVFDLRFLDCQLP